MGKKPGTFQRTLNKLASEGILESEYIANLRYFKVNKNHPLFKELKNIVFKTVGIKGSIEKVLKEIRNIKFAFIYGSYAKAKENYFSDIDLIIVGSPDEDELVKKIDRLEEKLQREINYKIYSFFDFKKDIKEKEPFISEILMNKKIMILGDEDELRKIPEG
ncbi:MAG: nucleotidyltransferase domain-containing protein [Candidatus Hydrothermarchaeota archaeon]